MGEDPGESLQAQTARDMSVLKNIDIIIVIEEPECRNVCPKTAKVIAASARQTAGTRQR